LVELLKHGEIVHHKTGTHRRVYLKDVLEYRGKRDAQRKKILSEMANQAIADGDYDQIYIPDGA
jgi:hypothetical protein